MMEDMIWRMPVKASLVLMPPLVRADTEDSNSSRLTPASAAIGATSPTDLESSSIVVLPYFIATNMASVAWPAFTAEGP